MVAPRFVALNVGEAPLIVCALTKLSFAGLGIVTLVLLRSTLIVAGEAFGTARSGLPSKLKSPDVRNRGVAPAGKLVAASKPPLPLFRRTLTLVPPPFA